MVELVVHMLFILILLIKLWFGFYTKSITSFICFFGWLGVTLGCSNSCLNLRWRESGKGLNFWGLHYFQEQAYWPQWTRLPYRQEIHGQLPISPFRVHRWSEDYARLKICKVRCHVDHKRVTNLESWWVCRIQVQVMVVVRGFLWLSWLGRLWLVFLIRRTGFFISGFL
jgi:hypothetical protein